MNTMLIAFAIYAAMVVGVAWAMPDEDAVVGVASVIGLIGVLALLVIAIGVDL